jgi:hypothetical protein
MGSVLASNGDRIELAAGVGGEKRRGADQLDVAKDMEERLRAMHEHMRKARRVRQLMKAREETMAMSKKEDDSFASREIEPEMKIELELLHSETRRPLRTRRQEKLEDSKPNPSSDRVHHAETFVVNQAASFSASKTNEGPQTQSSLSSDCRFSFDVMDPDIELELLQLELGQGQQLGDGGEWKKPALSPQQALLAAAGPMRPPPPAMARPPNQRRWRRGASPAVM